MQTNRTSILSLALCTAAFATCATALPAIAAGASAPQWVQLLPAGTFNGHASQGKGPWTNAAPDAVIAASKVPFAVDYDHDTDLGRGSRAAAWIEELKSSGPNGEPGIWGRVAWTDAGGKAVAGHDYRYLSPVFFYDDKGVVTQIVRAALTNNPALLQLKALASQATETVLNEDLKKIATALGLDPETATLETILAAITANAQSGTALAAKQTLIGNIAKAAGITTDAAKIGDTEVTAICAKLKAPATGGDTEKMQSKIDELQLAVASLSAQRAGDTAEVAVEKAIAAGKVTPAQKDWAIDYAKREPDGFKAYCAAAPTILRDGRVALDKPADGSVTLSDEQRAICSQMGLSEEDFKKELKASTQEAA